VLYIQVGCVEKFGMTVCPFINVASMKWVSWGRISVKFQLVVLVAELGGSSSATPTLG